MTGAAAFRDRRVAHTGSGARGGFSVSDVVLALAALSVVVAMVWPWVVHARFLDRVEAATVAVERARLAVLAHREAEGAWPPAADAGGPPSELVPYLDASASFLGPSWRLEIERWQAVEAPPPLPQPPEGTPPPPIPDDTLRIPTPMAVPLVGLTLHSRDEALLASLQDAYGPTVSFVRDTTWTLVFPRQADPFEEEGAFPVRIRAPGPTPRPALPPG